MEESNFDAFFFLRYISQLVLITLSPYTVYSQMGIPIDKSRTITLKPDLQLTTSLTDSIFFVFEYSPDTFKELKDFSVIEEAVSNWNETTNKSEQEKLEIDSNNLEEVAKVMRSFFTDYIELDSIFNIGYRKYLERNDQRSISFMEGKSDYERTLEILIANRLFLNETLQAEGQRENPITFDQDVDVAIVQEKENSLDKLLKEKKRLLEERAGLAAYYYNRTKSYNTFYFPLFDWKEDLEKSKLTELFFTNQFSEDNINALSSSLLSIDFDNQASLFAEVISAYIGPGKIGLSTLISANQSDTIDVSQENAIQRLIGGGGNIALAYQVPFVNVNFGEKLTGGTMFQARLGTDIPALNTTLDTTTFQYELSHQGFINLYTNSDALSFFAGFKIAFVSGDSAYQFIIDKDSFDYNQLSMGMTINETFRIVYNRFGGSSFARENFPRSTMSVILVPN